jgi:membrane fusion protein
MGAISLAQPIAVWLVWLFSLAILSCLIAYVTLGSVTKKARVVGITVPTAGSVSIAASSSGVLVRSMVAEGARVHAGQALFELSMERRGSQGELSALVGQQIAIRKQTLLDERRMRIAQERASQQMVSARIDNLDMQAEQMRQEVLLARRRRDLAQQSMEKYDALQKSGFASSMQSQQKQEELIAIESQLSTLLRAREQLLANRLALLAERKKMGDELATQLIQLARADAAIDQEVAENQGRKTNLIVAPKAGMITTITFESGQAVNGGQVLATLMADGAADARDADLLHVDLYAPSRTAGFVEPGQSVLIRYHAFPYQKFGLQAGVVTAVSKTPFAPNELPPQIASTILSNAQQTARSAGNEALYRIRVKPARQAISLYGKAQPLKPGMTLDADVIQDQRKIWEWVLDPLLAITHRRA